MTLGVFISSTGTGSGKTFVSRGLARAMRELGLQVGALKPLETGCEHEALDAVALAAACSEPELAHARGLYRAKAAVSPFAATLLGEPAPRFDELCEAIRTAGRGFERLVVEGAGGLLVPLDERRDMGHLAHALAFPIILVAPNRLGVLSHVLAVAEVARSRALTIRAVVLTEPDASPDASSSTNALVLRSRLSCPILSFPHCADDDAVLAEATRASGLLEAIGLKLPDREAGAVVGQR